MRFRCAPSSLLLAALVASASAAFFPSFALDIRDPLRGYNEQGPYVDIQVTDDAESMQFMRGNLLSYGLAISDNWCGASRAGWRTCHMQLGESVCLKGTPNACTWWALKELVPPGSPMPVLPNQHVKVQASKCTADCGGNRPVIAVTRLVTEAQVWCTQASGSGCPCKMFPTSAVGVTAGEMCTP